MPLLVIFVLWPLLELWLMLQVGDRIGAFWTVMLVVLTAAAGISILRWLGQRWLQEWVQQQAQGQVPGVQLLRGVMLAIAGILLIIPGFFTDTLGLLMLLPMTRQLLAGSLLQGNRYQTVSDRFGRRAPFHTQERESSQGPVTLEGEYKKEE